LSKFVMPLSVPSKSQLRRSQPSTDENEMVEESTDPVDAENANTSANKSQKHHRLINPLSLNNHPQFEEVRICASMVDKCLPAFLAACSTFLNAALDSDFYHNLVRTI